VAEAETFWITRDKICIIQFLFAIFVVLGVNCDHALSREFLDLFSVHFGIKSHFNSRLSLFLNSPTFAFEIGFFPRFAVEHFPFENKTSIDDMIHN
jgi:hypothetical protein